MKRMVAVRNYSTNILIEKKTNRRGRGGVGEGYGIFRDKIKNLIFFME